MSIISTNLLFNSKRLHVILIYHPSAEFKYVLTSPSFQHSAIPSVHEDNGTNWYLQIKAFYKYTRRNVEQPVKWTMRGTKAVLEMGILHISYKTLILGKFMTYYKHYMTLPGLISFLDTSYFHIFYHPAL